MYKLTGASQLCGTQLKSGVFGDFDAASSFQTALVAAHQSHVESMEGASKALGVRSQKTDIAATTFVSEDEGSAQRVAVAGDLQS
ncbi:DUF2563 family protein [Mycolicibacterium neoaurum]|uniref:DUF2563 family protein n=1 Tax=Mycolicibacterium neoaurum TaxID=1795 RepID=UPI003B008C30